ncbi:MAG: glycerol-3-phosphate 1-O-acyltransferase [Spirochaetaceae bacterium]|nr:glycerol-3-phosphate 1-O-acyltransferase [Myxococcales bacterium]MCB9725646.1 glycerol-3-phosphate 1-O-acyltransferase [Spirochaetaceae bacterium]
MDPSTSEAIPNPAWPGAPGERVLFLLDAASALEVEVLRSWIESARPDGLPADRVEAIRIPSSRRPRPIDGAALEVCLSSGEPLRVAPLRVVWLAPEREGRREAGLLDLMLLGDPRDPGPLRARFIQRFAPDRCRVVAGEPATARALRRRWQEALGSDLAETTGLVPFVVRQAALALDRAERRHRGGRYKIPRFLKAEILDRPAFRGGLEQIAREAGRPIERVRKEADRALREIAASHSPLWIDVFARLCRSSSTRGYDHLRVDPVEIEAIRALSSQHPVVFLPTHKSNLDHPVVFRALHERGLPPSHTAGGDNMNFFPQGPIARRAGIFFIRRSFGDDPVYKFVMRSYVDFLVEKRFPLQWFIEGGRSRSGKLLPPRYGLLAYVVDSYLRGKSEDVILVPVSVAYDQISEVADYAAEQRGAPKEREGIGWLFRFLKGLGRHYGSIDLRFGEPISLRTALGEPNGQGVQDPLVVPKLAFEVCSRINRVTPVTPISLATLAMLGSGDRAMALEEIHRELADLTGFVTGRGLPVSEKLRFESLEAVEATLDTLVSSGVLERFDAGPERIYSIAPGQHLAAAYYRNTMIHFLTNGAIAELALLRASEAAVGEAGQAFWGEALRLRDLLKFDFFFSEKPLFVDELRHELSLHAQDWEKRVDDPDEAREILESIRPFQANRTLRAFLEAYSIVADRLASLGMAPVTDERALVRDCLLQGEQYLRQRRIRGAESVSRTLLQNGVRLAGNRGLLAGDPAEIVEARLRFAAELSDTIRRIDGIEALVSARRTGAIR